MKLRKTRVNWYINFIQTNPLINMETIERQFCMLFRSIKSNKKFISKLSKIKQTNTETIDEYYSEFLKLQDLLLIQPNKLILKVGLILILVTDVWYNMNNYNIHDILQRFLWGNPCHWGEGYIRWIGGSYGHGYDYLDLLNLWKKFIPTNHVGSSWPTWIIDSWTIEGRLIWQHPLTLSKQNVPQ